jgi:hypothetical protein
MTGGEHDAPDATQPAAVPEAAEGPSEAHAEQDGLTQSVGQRLTRESHDAHRPRWRRWFGKR